MKVKYVKVDSTVSPKKLPLTTKGGPSWSQERRCGYMLYGFQDPPQKDPEEEWVVVAVVLLARLWPMGIHKTRNTELFKY